MINCMSSNNVDSMMIASSVDLLQRDSNVKFKCLHNDEIKVINIINLLTQILMLKKEKNKDHSWKEVILKLIQHLWNVSERKIKSQDAFIAKNVQKLKIFFLILTWFNTHYESMWKLYICNYIFAINMIFACIFFLVIIFIYCKIHQLLKLLYKSNNLCFFLQISYDILIVRDQHKASHMNVR